MSSRIYHQGFAKWLIEKRFSGYFRDIYKYHLSFINETTNITTKYLYFDIKTIHIFNNVLEWSAKKWFENEFETLNELF